MATVTYDEVNLMLRLYDLRREQRLRQARSWYLDYFHPSSPDEMMESYKAGSDEYNSIRMVLSYWDMVASIVNRGLINDELFFESNGEMWVVWDRIRGIVPTWRAAFKKSHGVSQSGRSLQAAGGLAGKESAGFEFSDAADDAAGSAEVVARIMRRRLEFWRGW